MFLTDNGCLLMDKAITGASQEILLYDNSTGQIQTSSKSLSDDGELDLTFDEWHQAWRHLLDLIRTYIPKEFLMWEIHYSYILNNKNCAEMWPEIRKRAIQSPVDPSVFSIGVWNDLEARYTAKKVLSIVRSNLKQQSGRPSNQSNSRNQNQGSSFRNQQQSSSDNPKTGRCFFCGDCTKQHLSHNFTAICNTSSAPCHLYRSEPSGTRQSKSGKRYCFTWNGPSGCKGSPCHKGEHWCTLCGSMPNCATPLPSLLPIITPFIPDEWECLLNNISPFNIFPDVVKTWNVGAAECGSGLRGCGVNFAELRTRPQLIGCALT